VLLKLLSEAIPMHGVAGDAETLHFLAELVRFGTWQAMVMSKGFCGAVVEDFEGVVRVVAAHVVVFCVMTHFRTSCACQRLGRIIGSFMTYCLFLVGSCNG
jgi:hypothetical protein